MRSSTSNSKRPGPLARGVAAFGLAFALLSAGGFLAGRFYPSLGWQGSLPPVPPNDRYVITEAYSDSATDLYTLYYNIGSAMDAARKADILIVGNSKPFFAFRNPALLEFSRRTSWKVFNLAMPCGSDLNSARALIERFHLRPQVLIVAENHFFNPVVSPYDRDTMAMGPLRARFLVFEENIAWPFRATLHRFFPRFDLGRLFGPEPVVLYRSLQNGCLSMENFSHYPVPVGEKDPVEEKLSAEEFKIAMEFRKQMESQGTRILLTSIPCGTDEADHLDRWVSDPEKRRVIAKAEETYEKADQAAARLGLPCLEPEVKGLFTFDGRHLDGKSAEKFTAVFWGDFLKLSMVKDLRPSSGP